MKPMKPLKNSSNDLTTLTVALRRAARTRSAPAILIIFAALCTAFLWTPVDTAALADETGFARDTVTRSIRTLVRAGALQQRPAPHGHRREVRLTPMTPTPPMERMERRP